MPIKLKIPIITFYVFSSENWKRPKSEINFLFKLIDQYFSREINNVIKQEIKLNFFGELNQLPLNVKKSELDLALRILKKVCSSYY